MPTPLPLSIHWSVGPSIPMELDLVLTAASGYFLPNSLPEDYTQFILSLPPDWSQELPEYLGQEPTFSSLLEVSAYLAGTMLEGDYSQATIPIRELTLSQAFERLIHETNPEKGEAVVVSPSQEQFIELGAGALNGAFSRAGFSPSETASREIQAAIQLKKVTRILHGGDLHSHFWHWLDRFYYQIYQPWRQGRAGVIDHQIRRAIAALGGIQGEGLPNLDWLPPQNPLLRTPPLRNAIESLGLKVFFWAEPFGMMDAWSLYPDIVSVTFAQPGIIFENFRVASQDIANRIAALADPTRLMILRIIRQFGMDNTEIAAFLGLARPTVSIHAKILREAGLIRSYPVGRSVRHEINPKEVRRLYNELQHLLDLPPEKVE